MTKKKLGFICESCSHTMVKWVGKCPECDEWNTFFEVSSDKNKTDKAFKSSVKKISEIYEDSLSRYSSGLTEFDRVLGGGVTKASIVLLGGEPGIGKSTLIMEICKELSSYGRILYVSGEESVSQVVQRSKRLKISSDDFLILNESCWQDIAEEIKYVDPTFLVIDSIQTMRSIETNSIAGSSSQIRDVTYELMNFCKNKNITCFVIGHVTKDGNIAGPKVLEHIVDTVIYFEGERDGQYRILKTIKNRFGPTNEIGIFEMEELGLKEVSNPAQYFIENNYQQSYGRSLTLGMEGSRSLFVEIQSLVVENKLNHSVRTCQGYDSVRLHMLMAVIDKYLRVPLSLFDIYLNITGGIKLTARESDLAIIASLLSSHYKKKINYKSVYLGEVGLTGEIRNVINIKQRLKEIEKLKYEKVVLGHKQAEEFQGKYDLKIIGIKKIDELRSIMFN